jgi:hypothetical protein
MWSTPIGLGLEIDPLAEGGVQRLASGIEVGTARGSTVAVTVGVTSRHRGCLRWGRCDWGNGHAYVSTARSID